MSIIYSGFVLRGQKAAAVALQSQIPDTRKKLRCTKTRANLSKPDIQAGTQSGTQRIGAFLCVLVDEGRSVAVRSKVRT